MYNLIESKCKIHHSLVLVADVTNKEGITLVRGREGREGEGETACKCLYINNSCKETMKSKTLTFKFEPAKEPQKQKSCYCEHIGKHLHN